MSDEVTTEEQIAKSIVPETVLAYIAGVVDGEGNIGIKTHQSKRQVNHSFSLMVRVASTTVSVIDFIQSHLGGSVYSHKNHTVNRKTMYELSWCASDARAVLSLLLPYLIIKRKIAEMGIAFQDIRQLKGGLRSDHVPKWQLEIMEAMYAKSREYNS